ncbi:MAG: response regulator [Xanthomonadales bacterium]|nr:response regulator [Xanthomonadales bacterium]
MSKGIILVVDDQPLIVKLVVAVLDDVGLDIMFAGHSRQAMDLAAEHRDRIRLLITDLRMSGMDGEELAREISLHCPDLRVLFMSGEAISDVDLAEGPRRDFIAKPFAPAELVRRVEALLSESTQ